MVFYWREEKSPFVLLFDPGGFLIITHLFLLPFCQFPNFEHFESKQNEKREKFDRYVCDEFAFGSKNLSFFWFGEDLWWFNSRYSLK